MNAPQAFTQDLSEAHAGQRRHTSLTSLHASLTDAVRTAGTAGDLPRDRREPITFDSAL